MIRQSFVISILTAISILSSGLAFSANQNTIYGSQFMTQEERLEYRKKQLNAKTDKERALLREEHQALMQQRAKKRKVTLPKAPSAKTTGVSSGNSKKPTTNWGGGWESRDY